MGLRRHQVENLIRRGPNFYWRARIPVGFRAAGKNTRLSLSLRLSDRKIASVVARRLNALLLQIELLPRARMATKEQLAKIFALEIESMRDEIEKLDRAAKRGGSLRDSVHREADRQVGYGFSNTLKQAGISEGVIEDLSGRLGNTETATRYTNPAGLSLLQAILENYPVITDHLEPQPIRLLPWVEEKLPPPWAGQKSGDRFGDKRGRRPKKAKA